MIKRFKHRGLKKLYLKGDRAQVRPDFLNRIEDILVRLFVTSFNQETNTWLDAFGRPLSEAPWVMHFIFGQEHFLAGWRWFLADMGLFGGGIAGGFALVNYGFKNEVASTNRLNRHKS